MRVLIWLVMFYQLILGSVTFEVKTGWNLLGTIQELNCSVLPENVASLYVYQNGTWYIKSNSAGGTLETIAPYSGFWLFANTDGNVTFDAHEIDVKSKELDNGWNLVSGALPLERLINDDSVVIMWSYENGQWSYATSDLLLQSLAQTAGYVPLEFDGLMKRGVWIYVREPLNVSLELYKNYFYGSVIDPLYTGIQEKVVVVSNNYPSNRYGYFLKNGRIIAPDDKIIEPTDTLSFVPSNTTSINFLNLEDIVVEYMPLNTGLSIEPAANMSFSIIMPKLGGYEVSVDGKEIKNRRAIISEIGRHSIDVALLDREGNRIKNFLIYLDTNNSDRFETVNMSTGADGIARNSFFVPNLRNEMVSTNYYFFDAYGTKYTIPLELVVSVTQIELAQSSAEVNFAEQNITIEGRVYDKTTQSPLANFPIAIETLPLNYGMVDNFTTQTDENGYFHFQYRAPQQLPSGEYNLTVYNDYANTTFILLFHPTVPENENVIIESNKENYVVTQSAQNVPIELFVSKIENNLAIPYPNLSISAAFEGTGVGSFDKVEGKTDESGKITFTYISPREFDALQTVVLVFYKSDDPTVRREVTIRFLPNGVDEGSTLSLTPERLIVNEPQGRYEIKAELHNIEGQAIGNVPVELVGALVVDGLNYGSVEQREVLTDQNGVASFIYIAPPDLSAVDGKELNVSIVVPGTDIEKNVTIAFSAPMIPRIAHIVVDPHELSVDSTTFTKDIAVYTYDQNGRPISATVVVDGLISPDDNRTLLGNVNPAVITTDQNGRGIFTYRAPEAFELLGGKSYGIRIYSEQNDSVEANMTLSFLPNREIVQKILLLPSKVSVVNGLSQQIRILTLDGNNYPVSSLVRISLPLYADMVLGTFSAYEVETDQNGEGVVTYTAPIDTNISDGEYNVSFTSGDVSGVLTLEFVETNVATDYIVKLSVPSRISVEGSDRVVVEIVKKSDENTPIEDNAVKAVRVNSRNGLFVFSESGNEIFEYNETSIRSIPIQAQRVSGIDVVDVEAEIFDGENDVNISASLPLTVISGPVSAISMVYKSVEYNAPFFEERYMLHAVDKYGNPAREGTKIIVGVVAGVRNDKNGNPIVIFDKNATLTASSSDLEKSEINLTASNPLDLSTVHGFDTQEGQDTVVILANDERYSPLYLGGWYVYGVKDDNKTLILEQKYDLNTTFVDKLNFIVGDEKRYNECEMTYNVIDFDEPTKEYLLDSNGNAEIVLRYDPFFVGHDVFFYANAINDNNERIGVANRRKIWGTGIDTGTFSCVAGENAAKTCTQSIEFRLKDALVSMKDIDFTLANFRFEDIDDQTICSYSSVNLIKSNTGCDGSVIITITVNANSGCKVSWNGSLNYEY